MVNPFLTTEEFHTWFLKDKTQIISHRIHLQKSAPSSPLENSIESIRHLFKSLPRESRIILETDVRKAIQSQYSFEYGIFISHDAVIKDIDGYQIDLEKSEIEDIREITLKNDEKIPIYSNFMEEIYINAKTYKHKVLVNVEAKTEDCMQDIVEDNLKLASTIPGYTRYIRLLPSSFNLLNVIDFHLNFPDHPSMILIDDHEIKTGTWKEKQKVLNLPNTPAIGLSVNALMSKDLAPKTDEILSQISALNKGITVFTVNDIETYNTIKRKCSALNIPLYSIFSDEYHPLLTHTHAAD